MDLSPSLRTPTETPLAVVLALPSTSRKTPRTSWKLRPSRYTFLFIPSWVSYLTSCTQTIAKKYSEFINFPIYLWASHTESKEVPVEEEEVPVKETKETDTEDVEVEEEEDIEDEEEEKPKTKTVTETVWDWELLNQTKPIWTRSPKDVTEEEYTNFYKSISKDVCPHLFPFLSVLIMR
jgi:hypothetical protein